MVLLESALVLGIVGLIIYGTIRLLAPPQGQHRRPASSTGQWRAAHFDVEGETRVVLQKVSPSGNNVLDEHLIATVRVDDPEYDEKFLTAMSTARERRALFEAEED
jgi:hypothetical protein